MRPRESAPAATSSGVAVDSRGRRTARPQRARWRPFDKLRTAPGGGWAVPSRVEGRLLDTGPGAGDWNMALDQALVDENRAGNTAPILRFYSWGAPTLSFGRTQQPPGDLLRRCAELGVMAVRRPTGGKAIFHHHEVTFSIIAPARALGSVMESYRTFARAIAAGLARLGVQAALCEPRPGQRRAGLLCFAAPAECDLQVGGRKLLGSAQARSGAMLLQQNSLPLVLSHDLKKRLLGMAAADEEGRVATDLTSALACPEPARPGLACRELTCPELACPELVEGVEGAERGRQPSFAEVRDAIISGFESELGVTFEPSDLAPAESGAAEKLRSAFRL